MNRSKLVWSKKMAFISGFFIVLLVGLWGQSYFAQIQSAQASGSYSSSPFARKVTPPSPDVSSSPSVSPSPSESSAAE